MNQPKGFFVTGTDTGVGKTVITVALIKALNLLGYRACGMKPIESGCLRKGDMLIPSDGMFIKTMSEFEETVDYISPCRFESPLAPLPASELEGVSVNFDLIQKSYDYLLKKYDIVIFEGIGGLLVPIKRNYSVLDLAKDFGLPIIVVSRPSLGTLNHTMLTVNCAIRAGLHVAGIILNYSQPPEDTLAEKTNPEAMKQISPVPIIGIFPYLKEFESRTVENAVAENLDIEIIKRYL